MVVIEIKDEEKLKDIEAPPPTQTGGTSLFTKYKRKLRRFSKSGIKKALRRMERMNEEKNYELEIKMLEKNKTKDDMKFLLLVVNILRTHIYNTTSHNDIHCGIFGRRRTSKGDCI